MKKFTLSLLKHFPTFIMTYMMSIVIISIFAKIKFLPLLGLIAQIFADNLQQTGTLRGNIAIAIIALIPTLLAASVTVLFSSKAKSMFIAPICMLAVVAVISSIPPSFLPVLMLLAVLIFAITFFYAANIHRKE